VARARVGSAAAASILQRRRLLRHHCPLSPLRESQPPLPRCGRRCPRLLPVGLRPVRFCASLLSESFVCLTKFPPLRLAIGGQASSKTSVVVVVAYMFFHNLDCTVFFFFCTVFCFCFESPVCGCGGGGSGGQASRMSRGGRNAEKYVSRPSGAPHRACGAFCILHSRRA
jgi:hypothetical protein